MLTRTTSSGKSRAPALAGAGLLLALLVVVAGGCGPRKGSADAGAPRPDLGLLDLGDGAGDRGVCVQVENLAFDPMPVPVDLLILFDRSESMAAEFGGGTRFSVEAQLMASLLPGYEDRIRFGFQTFPARGACPSGHVSGCCAEGPSVPVGPGSAAAVTLAIEDAAPVGGNTPTAEALRLARQYYATLQDGVVNRYVLLSTDGRPTCTATGQLPDPPDSEQSGLLGACADALVEVDALRAAGVKVIVLGVGAELATVADEASACLEEMARRGGAGRSDGPPAFFTAQQPAALEASLNQIFGGTLQQPCIIELAKPPADRAQVRVLFDGKEIPRNRLDGWDFDPPSDTRRIRVFGAACQRLHRLSISSIEVQYGCPPCADLRTCE